MNNYTHHYAHGDTMNSNYRPIMFRFMFLPAIFFIIGLLLLSACSAPTTKTSSSESIPQAVETVNPMFSDTNNTEQETTPDITQAESGYDGIVIDIVGETKPFNTALLGTNVPAWLGQERTTNETFIELTEAAGVSMLRIPGGSWANYYEWLPCEQENICPWDWGALTPTGFINLINTTGLEAMYIINMNGTAKEAAALVAFFNGSIDDETMIGVDVLGNDWGKVSDWAQLRSDHGNPNPVGIKYWEIGNEIYAGKEGMGTDCNQSWGWEDVWTCDGTEYVMGIGEGEERKEGFLEYIDAMKAVDPSILIGPVGIPQQDDWNNWGNEVIAAAGDVMDFYSVHEYGFFNPPRSNEDILAKPQSVWGPMRVNIQDSFDNVDNGRSIPIAVTEYNLFSAEDKDNDQLMTRAVNMLFMADTIGQMATHGFTIANQWNLANGQANNGTDYGIIHADSFERYPQYYIFPLWAKFGNELLPVTSPFASDTTLSTYAGKNDEGMVSLLAINKTSDPISSEIQLLNNAETYSSVNVNVVQAESLDSQAITLNGNPNPADNLSDAPPTILETVEVPFSYTFAPYSITLLQFTQ